MGRLFSFIFGKRIGRLMASIIAIPAGIYALFVLNGPDAASYGGGGSDPTVKLVGIIVPLFFIVVGLLGVVLGLKSLVPRGRVSPVVAISRLILGGLFIGAAVYLFQSRLVDSLFTTIPPSQSAVIPLFTYGIPGILALGGCLMMLWGLLGLILGRAKSTSQTMDSPPFQVPAAPQLYSAPGHGQPVQPFAPSVQYNQWGQEYPPPQPPYDPRKAQRL